MDKGENLGKIPDMYFPDEMYDLHEFRRPKRLSYSPIATTYIPLASDCFVHHFHTYVAIDYFLVVNSRVLGYSDYLSWSPSQVTAIYGSTVLLCHSSAANMCKSKSLDRVLMLQSYQHILT